MTSQLNTDTVVTYREDCQTFLAFCIFDSQKPYPNTVLARISFIMIKVKCLFIWLKVICIPFLCEWKAHMSCSFFKMGYSSYY